MGVGSIYFSDPFGVLVSRLTWFPDPCIPHTRRYLKIVIELRYIPCSGE